MHWDPEHICYVTNCVLCGTQQVIRDVRVNTLGNWVCKEEEPCEFKAAVRTQA